MFCFWMVLIPSQIAIPKFALRNSLIELEVLLLDGVDIIKYLTYNSDAFQVSKVYNTGYHQPCQLLFPVLRVVSVC